VMSLHVYSTQRVMRQGAEFWLVAFRAANDTQDSRALVCPVSGTVTMPHRLQTRKAALSAALRDAVGFRYAEEPANDTEALEPDYEPEGDAPSVAWRIGAALRFLCVCFVLGLALPILLFAFLTWR